MDKRLSLTRFNSNARAHRAGERAGDGVQGGPCAGAARELLHALNDVLGGHDDLVRPAARSNEQSELFTVWISFYYWRASRRPP